MHRSVIRSFWIFIAAGVLALACGPQSPEVPPGDSDDDDSGGTGASGGTATGGTGFSGTSNTGGFSGTGFSGGSTGVGGTGFAGSVATGGSAGTGFGGAMTGGTAGFGNVGNTGGVPAAGTGGAPTGGTAGAPATTCDPMWSVGMDGFVRSPGAAAACWHGYAYTSASGVGSSVVPANFMACTTCNNMLCITGAVGAADAAVALVGFNINQPAGSATAVPRTPPATATGLRVNFTKTGTFPLRVQIQDASGTAAGRWCYTVDAATGPIDIPYASFNTQCWVGGAGVPYAKQPITAAMLLIPGSPAGAATFNTCLTSLAEY